MKASHIFALLTKTLYGLPMIIWAAPIMLFTQFMSIWFPWFDSMPLLADWWKTLLLWPALVVTPFLLARAQEVPPEDLLGMDYSIPRYRLRNYARWAETPDQLLPCDLNVPTSAAVYKHLGWFMAGWYNIGIRNIGHGILWQFGFEMPAHDENYNARELFEMGFIKEVRRFWIFEIRWGHNTYNDFYNVKSKTGYWAVPIFTIRLAE